MYCVQFKLNALSCSFSYALIRLNHDVKTDSIRCLHKEHTDFVVVFFCLMLNKFLH